MGDNYWHQLVCDTIDEVFKLANLDYSIEDYDKPLTGNKFGLGAIELAYLFMALEKRLGMRFHISESQRMCFYTINSIAGYLKELCPAAPLGKSS